VRIAQAATAEVLWHKVIGDTDYGQQGKALKRCDAPLLKEKRKFVIQFCTNTNWVYYSPSGYTANCIGLSQADAWISTFVCDAYLTKEIKHENTLRYYAIK